MDTRRLGLSADGRKVGVIVAVLGVIAFGLASTSPASANLGDTNTQAVTLGPLGSIAVSGTIDCAPPSPFVQGGTFSVFTTVRQKGHGGYNSVTLSFGMGPPIATCPTSGPGTWSLGPAFGPRPFHGGHVAVQTNGFACSAEPFGSNICRSGTQETKELRVTH